MKLIASALAHLTNHIQQLQEKHRVLKPQLEKTTKELAALGAKPDDPIDEVKLPIGAPFIKLTSGVLDDQGRNVKNFQKAMGVFDVAEFYRQRKALVAAGVTKETENYNGNSTFVELTPEFQKAILDSKAKADTEVVTA